MADSAVPDAHPVRPVADSAMLEQDLRYMEMALQQAALAESLGEVPVGALVVDTAGQVVATGFNRTITDHDPTAHAEVVALRNAAQLAQNYRLPGYSLYVTLEPCAMCMGAMMHARLARVVFGAHDPKTGVCGSVLNLPGHTQLNHQTTVTGGIHADACGHVLRQFFKKRRSKET